MDQNKLANLIDFSLSTVLSFKRLHWLIQRFSEEKEIAAISLVLMWFNKTFEKVVITEPVQVRFFCWLLGIGSTLSEVILIYHSIRPGSSEVAFFDYRYGFNLPYSPKSLLHISLLKKQPGSPIFFILH
ncbi:hypothetical protein KIL84_005145 [Mauremys mutica]|uniref:Uncharacterized protein n=1 Tax=Mauremys mutica TaxID=74926 RepID=A0A9D3XH57_9SAUR|nr:hypothetical protein KIL84_005145 [Mauremys mutica]